MPTTDWSSRRMLRLMVGTNTTATECISADLLWHTRPMRLICSHTAPVVLDMCLHVTCKGRGLSKHAGNRILEIPSYTAGGWSQSFCPRGKLDVGRSVPFPQQLTKKRHDKVLASHVAILSRSLSLITRCKILVACRMSHVACRMQAKFQADLEEDFSRSTQKVTSNCRRLQKRDVQHFNLNKEFLSQASRINRLCAMDISAVWGLKIDSQNHEFSINFARLQPSLSRNYQFIEALGLPGKAFGQ
ncbi:hypothetical protein B0T20DRAFT_470728 [Sordaria brevicollis]|uniref:Uncharacterized protein n=1 Tax=Sordaria brevicollis TaxID=83679 RepID=A0AAE0PC43_SORBR|nr:hypothetical protein B0T20DRAFT_470728 [Sordaria brevicollis]